MGAALLRNKRVQSGYARGTYAFHDWIRESLLTNKPYDQFVREILTASGDIDDNPPVAWYRQDKDPTTQLEDVGQLFLGMRMHCAQCHHHPFERWSQQVFYSFAAFFSNTPTSLRQGRADPATKLSSIVAAMPLAINPKTKQPVRPASPGEQTARAFRRMTIRARRWLTG